VRLLRPLLIAAFAALPIAVQAHPPVWIVSDKDSTVVLFGSVHILPKVDDWRPKALTDALAKADDVWFEIPLDDAARLQASQLVAAKGLAPKGQSLAKLLPKRDQQRLQRVAKALNLPMAQLDLLQPWLAEVSITAAFMASRGATDEQGVESVLAAAAPATAKIRAFETPSEQISLLADLPRDVQLAALADTLEEIEERPDSFDKLIAYWISGDVERLRREVVDPLKKVSPTLYRAMIQRRNAAWTKVIAERMAGSGETVIIVGAGHLVGPEGVPALLRARGLKVEGP